MSPSDEGLGWHLFDEREAGRTVELRSPAAELATVLQQHRADLDAARAEVAAAQRAGIGALARQAVLAVQLEAALAHYEPDLQAASLGKAVRHLLVLKDQMLDELAGAGVELVRLAGRPYDEIAGLVEVEGWLHRDDLESEVVVEELAPAVRREGELVLLGRVVMGAPRRAATPAAGGDDDSDDGGAGTGQGRR